MITFTIIEFHLFIIMVHLDKANLSKNFTQAILCRGRSEAKIIDIIL